METTSRRFDWIIRCFASMSPRSIFLASSTSCAAVRSACLPASRRKSCSASVVVSTGWTAAGGGAGASSFSSSTTSSMPRRSSSWYTESVSSGSSSSGSRSSFRSTCRSCPLVSAASSSAASSSFTRIDSISTVKFSPWIAVGPGPVCRAFTQPKHAGGREIKLWGHRPLPLRCFQRESDGRRAVQNDDDAVRLRAFELSLGPDSGSPEENWLRAEWELATPHQDACAHDYDTVDCDLERRGLRLERLPGEAGAVWRLTLPRGEQVEAWEPGNRGLAPPDEIASLIGAVTAGKPLAAS